MSRYDNIQINKTVKGRDYLAPVLYPKVEYGEDDIYVISTEGDRYDNLALEFYGNMEYWWVIMAANGGVIPGDSLVIKPGTQIRIPQDPEDYLRQFQKLNS